MNFQPLLFCLTLISTSFAGERDDEPRVLVALLKAGSQSLTEKEQGLLMDGSNWREVKDSGEYDVINLGSETFVLLHHKLPSLLKLRRARAIVEAFSKPGTAIASGDLPSALRMVISTVLEDYGLLPEPFSPEAKIGMEVDARFHFDVGGKSVQLSIPLLGGSGLASVRQLIASPIKEAAKSSSPTRESKTPFSEATVQVFTSVHLRDHVARADLTRMGAQIYDEAVRRESELRDAVFKKLFDELLAKNASLLHDLPRNGMNLAETSPELQRQLQEQFLASAHAFGLGSGQEAEVAWSQAKLSRAHLDLGLIFAFQRRDGSVAPTRVSFATSRPGW
jgi:hypothetical protein